MPFWKSGHRLLLLLPCLPLADRAHPLDAPPGQDRPAWAQVDELLANPRMPNPQAGSIDLRWEWVAPLLLDRTTSCSRTRIRDVFGAYVDDLLAVDLQSLGRRPSDLAALLTDLALGSPAILAAPGLRGRSGVGDDARRRLAALIADAFWRLFNRPAVISLPRQLAAYRVVFGQPQQEELVTLLHRAGVDGARLRDLAVDLAAGDPRLAGVTQDRGNRPSALE